MLAALVSALLCFQSPGIVATRYEMGERVKALDIAWLGNIDKSRRAKAVQDLSGAVMMFFSGKYSDACAALDRATASLEGRAVNPLDAANFRFEPPFCEPGKVAKLVVTWAYPVTSTTPIPVQVIGKTEIVPGQRKEILVETRSINPETAHDPETGVLVPILFEGARRSAYLSLVKNWDKRVKDIQDAKDESAKAMAKVVLDGTGGKAEAEFPLIQYLFLAEQIEKGDKKVAELDQVPASTYRGTTVRAMIPTSAKAEATVVVALHGAGASENMFFESYGRGLAVREALKRGWVFISPRSSATAVQDAVDWLGNVRQIKTVRLFVMGHSMGGGLALQSGKVNPKPAGIAAFAPAPASIGSALDGIPVFLAVGKQEIPMLASGIKVTSKTIEQRPKSLFKEYDPCEHLMIVADAIPDAYSFFDGISN